MITSSSACDLGAKVGSSNGQQSNIQSVWFVYSCNMTLPPCYSQKGYFCLSFHDTSTILNLQRQTAGNTACHTNGNMMRPTVNAVIHVIAKCKLRELDETIEMASADKTIGKVLMPY